MDIQFVYSLFEKSNLTVTTDSRVCPYGSLFVALHGANFDGNLFAAKAIEAGCKYAIVDNPDVADEKSIFFVEDTLLCLQQLASYHRDQMMTPIIGVTGTNGKTTTKELIAAVLTAKYGDAVLYTKGNLNNHIGVPMTLLGLRESHRIAIVEMGANHPGEIRTLVNIAHPNCGMITNVGRAHLAGFGSFEGVVNTKCELYEYLSSHGGLIFVNGSNSILRDKSTICKNRVEYGIDGSKFQAKVVECNPFLKFSFEGTEVQTNLIGDYNLENILAAIAIGSHFGVETSLALSAISQYVPINNRSQMKRTASNNLIVDAYNANPTSMTASLRNLAAIKAEHKAVVLGDMRELGAESEAEHMKIVDLLSSVGVEKVVLIGQEFAKVAVPGMQTYGNVDEFISHIQSNPLEGYTILIKGSNSMNLVKTVEYL